MFYYLPVPKTDIKISIKKISYVRFIYVARRESSARQAWKKPGQACIKCAWSMNQQRARRPQSDSHAQIKKCIKGAAGKCIIPYYSIPGDVQVDVFTSFVLHFERASKDCFWNFEKKTVSQMVSKILTKNRGIHNQCGMKFTKKITSLCVH